MTITGLYWHVHHNVLAEWCYDYKKRVAYIKADKPAHEQELRLRLFKPVVAGPAAYTKVWAVYEKAQAAREKAEAAYYKAEAAYYKASVAYDKAWAAAQPALEALHKIECPNCPWDGSTIFPNKGAVKAYRRMIAAAPARTHALVKLVAAAQYVSGDMYRMSAADHGRMSGFDAFPAALVEAEKALRP